MNVQLKTCMEVLVGSFETVHLCSHHDTARTKPGAQRKVCSVVVPNHTSSLLDTLHSGQGRSGTWRGGCGHRGCKHPSVLVTEVALSLVVSLLGKNHSST